MNSTEQLIVGVTHFCLQLIWNTSLTRLFYLNSQEEEEGRKIELRLFSHINKLLKGLIERGKKSYIVRLKTKYNTSTYVRTSPCSLNQSLLSFKSNAAFLKKEIMLYCIYAVFCYKKALIIPPWHGERNSSFCYSFTLNTLVEIFGICTIFFWFHPDLYTQFRDRGGAQLLRRPLGLRGKKVVFF